MSYRGVEQLVARWAHNPKVASSSLAPATKKGQPGIFSGLSFLFSSKYDVNELV